MTNDVRVRLIGLDNSEIKVLVPRERAPDLIFWSGRTFKFRSQEKRPDGFAEYLECSAPLDYFVITFDPGDLK